MNIKKLRKKHNRYRCLKAISYLLGFPLFVVLVFIGSIPLLEGSAFTMMKYDAIIAAALIWVIAIVLQIVISIVTKSYNGRTLFMLIATLIIMVGGSVLLDMYVSGKIDDINKEYAEYGVEVDGYKYQVGWVITWTDRDGLVDKWNDEVTKFTTVYNIGYASSNYGGKNGDGSAIKYDDKADAYYSPNGLYADGYIFGFKQAVQVMIDYHQSKFDIEYDKVEPKNEGDPVTYEANGKSASEELAKALKAVDSSSEWLAYKKSEEYLAAYGEDGTAYKFMLNPARLNKLLKSLSDGLKKSGIFDEVDGILSGLSGLGLDLSLDDLLSSVGITVDDLYNITLDKALKVVNGLGVFDEPVTEDMLMELLENFSYYQSPTVRPKFDFIEDETIRRYAYAEYYATVHGANVGSILIAEGEDGRIGAVSMNGNGYPNSFAYSLPQLYELQAKDKVAEYYPLMILRRYMLIFAGVVAFTMVLMYNFKRKEDETFEKIAAGGRR